MRESPSRSPASLRGRYKHATASIFFVIVAVFLQGFGTSCVDDQFRCGIARSDDNSLGRTCDRTGEYCICETQRCAIRDAQCTSNGVSGLRYSFGDEECVTEAAVKTAIAQTAGGPAFCPGNGPDLPCGIAEGKPCGANEVCLCDGNRCATWDTGCDSRYRYVVTNDCVAAEKAQPERMLFTSEAGPGLCPGETQLLPPCGTPIAGQAPQGCEGSQICICAQNLFRCASLSPTCDTGYRWAQDGQCVVDKGLTKSAIEAANQQVNADGLCPFFVPKDAGSDANMPDGAP